MSIISASVHGAVISLTRGDTLKLYVEITQDGETYTPNEGDTIRFALKKKTSDSEPLILKDIPISTQLLTLEPSDTKGLEIGKYKYDIELTTVDGDVDTFIGPALFNLTEEVY